MTEEIVTGVHMKPDHQAENSTNQKILTGCLVGLIGGFVVGALLVTAIWGLSS